MSLPSFRKRKPSMYVFFGLYFLFSMLIIVESCFPGGASSIQSTIFADFGSFIVNLFTPPKIPDEIKPERISKISDSSYLGQNDNKESLIAIGTTTLLSLEVTYPKANNAYDVYDNSYVITPTLGNKDDYNLVLSSMRNLNVFNINLRIVANKMTSDKYKLNINIANTINYDYTFVVVPLATPTNFEAKIAKNNLKINETLQIDTKLISEKRDDYYLRRYYDTRLISHSSDNEAVATIDEYGVIHALSEGSTVIHYGTYEFPITVSGEVLVKPDDNELSLNVSETARDKLSLLDYDYVFTEDDPNLYSVLAYPHFSNNLLLDTSVSYHLSDNLMAKLAPYKYSDDGYPIYHDDLGKPCVRVSGYRKAGTVTLYCESNADDRLTASIDINISEALPVSFSLPFVSPKEMKVNEKINVSGVFNPVNVNNKNIHLEASNNKVSFINNDSTSVTIKGESIGKTHITVTSLADPTLKQEFDIKISAEEAINQNNFSDFHAFVRKFIGHFLLFLVDAIFGFIFFTLYFGKESKWWLVLLVTLGFGLLFASISELIQFFIPGRTGTLLDISIDFLGYVIGTLISFAIYKIVTLIKNKKRVKHEE